MYVRNVFIYTYMYGERDISKEVWLTPTDYIVDFRELRRTKQ